MPTQEWDDERCVKLYLSHPDGTQEWAENACCTEIPCRHGLGALVRAAVALARLAQMEAVRTVRGESGRPYSDTRFDRWLDDERDRLRGEVDDGKG